MQQNKGTLMPGQMIAVNKYTVQVERYLSQGSFHKQKKDIAILILIPQAASPTSTSSEHRPLCMEPLTMSSNGSRSLTKPC